MRSALLLCCAVLCACAPLLSQTAVTVQFADAQRRQRVDVASGQVRLQMCGLTLGHTYRVIASPAFAPAGKMPRLSLAPGEQPEADQRPNQQVFTASGPCMDLWMEVASEGGGSTGLVPLSISASCADCPGDNAASEAWKKKFKEKVGAADVAPLKVTGGVAATSLVRNTLIGGDCFDVTNITSVGNANSRGTFSAGTSSINIADGVVLCTGDVNELPGPNVLVDADGGFANDNTDDADLKKLIGNNQFDLSKIEFDFVPTANTLKFEFVFGSEEYCEFVGTNYNDVFGFFISGPGINGTLNIGLIPGTGTPVTINNVNHQSNSNYYRNNRVDVFNCGNLSAVAASDIELDGFTRVFTATANVQPCQKYHIKLAIADIQDDRYCSAVFLKANSFNAGGQVEAEPVYANSQPNAIENCGQSYIKFKRGSGDVNTALPVSYTIAPQSTALQGIDFAPLPNNVVIPAGQNDVLVPVNLFQDGMTEGLEKIELIINNSCSCTEQKVIFDINDKPLLDAGMVGKAICSGQPAVLEPNVSGGLAPVLYQWSTGASGSSITVNTPNTYTVTVSDACASSQVLTAQVAAQEVPTAALSGNSSICVSGGTATLTVALSGQAPWDLTWKADNGSPQTLPVFASPALIPVSAAGNYSLVSVATQNGCAGSVSGSATVTSTNLNLSLSPTNPPCYGIANGSVSAALTGGAQPYTYQWSNGAKTQNISGLPPGTYTVTTTENGGCTATQTAQLVQPTELVMAAEVKNHINCKVPTGAADLTASGGMPGTGGTYQVKWSNGATQSTATFSTGGTYTVTVSDQNNCTATAAVTILSDLTKPIVTAKALGQLNCNSDEVGLDATGSSTGPAYTFAWSGGPFICCENTFTPTVSQPGTYTLIISNTANGCTATATASVTENTDEPTALNLDLNPPGCKKPTGDISVLGVTGGTGPYRYDLDGSGNFGTLDQFKALAPGTHTIIVQDANGCEHTETIVFQEVILPDITLTPEVSIAFGETQQIKALLNIPLSLIDTIIWSPAEGLTFTSDPRIVEAQPFASTRYTATVITKNNCEDRATVQFRVDEPHIWAPNVFSPNNKDGENDRFYLFASPGSVRQVVSMQVFDRWGTLIFRNEGGFTDTERSGWDGTYRGKMLAPDVFVWCADLELANGNRVQLKGDVAIVR